MWKETKQFLAANEADLELQLSEWETENSGVPFKRQPVTKLLNVVRRPGYAASPTRAPYRFSLKIEYVTRRGLKQRPRK
jgi:hypothetical protein